MNRHRTMTVTRRHAPSKLGAVVLFALVLSALCAPPTVQAKPQISLEEVSKPFKDSEQARQVQEALEQVGVVFPARDEPAEIV